ncbi:hypothetical protein FLW16_40360 [Microbispora sp. KK1-11]|nr:hypothetical protein FLW16_40360 [Microbispora sp. KK1-11]
MSRRGHSLRCRGQGTPRCLGGRADRPGEARRLAQGDAPDRAQRAPPPRCPVALHRHRQAPLHLLRHQHHTGQLADLELRHRSRARCQDRIRTAKDTRLRNLPLHDFAQNQIWVEIVALACELLARMQMLALGGPARRYEPKRLRPHLFAIAARLVRGGRRLRLRIAASWPWAGQLVHRYRPASGAPGPDLTSTNPPRRPGRTPPRARGTPPTRRNSRATRLTTTASSHSSRTDQPGHRTATKG